MFSALSAFALVLTSAQAAIGGPSGSPATGCELHVWPAERMSGTPQRIGQIFIGRANGEEIEGAMTDLIGPAAQLAALRGADPVSQLGLPAGTRVVEHDEPLDRKSLNKVKTRRAASSSRCYAELIVMEHMLIEDVVWGDRFLTAFMFRDFGDAGTVRSVRKGGGGNKLKVLTQKEEKRPMDAPALVAAAIQGNFRESLPGLRGRTAAKR